MNKLVRGAKKFGKMMKETFVRWNDRDPFRSSAVISYYTIFSLPGLLVVIINVAGYFFGEEAVTNEITGQVKGVIGEETGRNIQQIIATTSQNQGVTISSILGVATLLFGATGVFYQIQQTLNIMWEVRPQPNKMVLKLIRDRVFSFGLILVVGFLLLVSLLISAALAAFSNWIMAYLPEFLFIVFRIADILISLAIITLLFAAIYKFLPDAEVRWRDVWVGALVTAVLFVAAKFLLGLYFGKADPASAYGAAGSLVLLMLWVSYSALILLFGAEFTQVYAKQYGRQIRPAKNAVSVKRVVEEREVSNSERKTG